MGWLVSAALVVSSVVGSIFNWQQLPEPLVNANVGEIRSEAATYYQPLPLKLAAQPIKTGQASLSLSATGVYSFDLATGQPLYVKDPDKQRPIASITKLATVMVILHDHKLDEVVTVPQLPSYKPEEVTIGLHAGQKLTIKSLLAAALIESANDAADTLAIVDSGSIEAFTKKMSELPKEWGISDLKFKTPSGLNDLDQASARAIGRIAALIIQNSTASELVKHSTANINDTSGQVYTLTNTDILLQNGVFTGIKTGYTPAAGQCFVGRFTHQGHTIITVVLGSSDRFGESTELANWIRQNYTWIEI